MNSIDEIQKEIIADFNEIGDPFDQYAYLISLCGAFAPMAEEIKTPDILVDGCQSKVWLHICKDDEGKFRFDADTDTLIIKGVLYLLQKCFCGQSPADVAASRITFLEETLIMMTFEDDRQKGIGFVIRKLQTEAAKM